MSAIRHLHYDAELAVLSLWFGPGMRRYKYFGVPLGIYEALRDAPSRTGYFNQHIRNRYACRLADPSEMRNQRWLDIRSAS